MNIISKPVEWWIGLRAMCPRCEWTYELVKNESAPLTFGRSDVVINTGLIRDPRPYDVVRTPCTNCGETLTFNRQRVATTSETKRVKENDEDLP